MADHWKSIANRLGAPGVDEPEVEVQAEEPKPKAVHPQSASSVKAPVRDSARSADEAPKASRGAASHVSAQPAESIAAKPTAMGPAELSFDPNMPIPDEALSFKTSRRSLTQNEPAQPPESRTATPAPSPSPPAARSFSEPSPPSAAEARREAPRMPDRFEPETVPAAPPAVTPPKRKSSWESLANMFNIKVDRSKPVEAVPEAKAIESPVRPQRPARPTADEDQKLSIFSGERSPRSNPALDAMFGDTPPSSSKTRSDDWGKPRVIDDLGWDSDEDKPAVKRGGFVESDEPHSDAAPSSIHESPTEGDDEEAPRRGRRRRRGRRGGRGDGGGEPSASSSSSSSAPRSTAADRPSDGRLSGWEGLDDSLENEDELSIGDDPWDEPESFEGVQLGTLGELDEESDNSAEELSADGEVLRRSSRRRRRGRGGRDRESGEATDETPGEIPASRPTGRGRSAPARSSSAPRDPRHADGSSDRVSFRANRDAEEFSDDSDRQDAPRTAASPRRSEARGDGRSEGRDSDEGSSPRRRRRSGSSPSSEKSSESRHEGSPNARGRSAEGRSAGRPSDSEGPIADDFDDISLGPAFDGEEDDTDRGDGTHRSIPTWADSIQSLVEINMENRKRGGDSRGGAPRGRPRGRR